MAERVGLVLACEGMGDCLFAIPVIRKMRARFGEQYTLDVFTHHPGLFEACPYVEDVFPIHDRAALAAYPHKLAKVFELDKLPHSAMDTFDFISVPLGLGTLTFEEKRLEYFPREDDAAEAFDVVLNTSMTWPSRSWPVENWQRLADALVARGLRVAVVGKDVQSAADKLVKRSPALERVTNLVNRLSLDQTYFTIRKAGLFVTCQNGLSVLAGATDTEIVVLDMSIDWSRRAIYREESPFRKVTYVKGGCRIYCGAPERCPLPENHGELRCIPAYEQVEAAVLAKIKGV